MNINFNVIGICVILPVLIVWLITRYKDKKNETNKQIIVTALEKNPNLNQAELLEMLNSPKKTLKEKMFNRHLWAIICLGLGLLMVIGGLVTFIGDLAAVHYNGVLFSVTLFVIGGANLAVGTGFLVNFLLGKKVLSKELSAEEQKSE